MTSNPFYDELNANFVENKLDEETIENLRERIGVPLDTIRAAYISTGPNPASPMTVLDVFLLTDAFIYNYEVTTEYNDQWFTLPLPSVSYIVENLSPQDDRFWSLLIVIRSRVGEPGLALQDRIENRDKINRFADACRDRLSAVISVQEHARGELNGTRAD